jgi:hypothetical protein
MTRDNNVSVEFDPNGFSIKDIPTQTVKLRCDTSGDLCPLWLPHHSALHASSTSAVELWHQRLGHPGSNSLHHVLNTFQFHCNKSATHSCHSCKVGKHVRLPFQSSDHRTFFSFQIVHSDVWTSPIYSTSGYKYYVVLLDDYTHYVWTFPIRQKSEVLPIIRSFFSYVQTQFGLCFSSPDRQWQRVRLHRHACLSCSSGDGVSALLPLYLPTEREGRACSPDAERLHAHDARAQCCSPVLLG